MRGRLTIGWIMFVAGILLDVVSEIANIWAIGVLAGVLWPVGMVIGINASISLKDAKQSYDHFGPLTEKEDMSSDT